MRTCTKCGIAKPETAEFFYAANGYVGGLMRQCIECKRQYYRANSAKITERSLERQKLHKPSAEKRAEYGRRARKKNPAKRNEYNKRWVAARSLQTPKWVDDDQIWMMREAYYLARLREKVLGGRWHVDHFIPLKGRSVCGLHVIENLRVVPISVNTSKGNRLLGDRPTSFF